MIPPEVLERLCRRVESSTELAEPRAVTVRTTPQLGAVPGAPPIERRADWGALPPKSNPGGYSSLDATVLHYTAASKGYMVKPTEPHSWCHEQMRSIQQQHQAIPEQSDFEYSAAVCGHGVLMEGRIAGVKGGANGSASSNATMPSCCCLAGVGDVPPHQMLFAVSYFHRAVEMRAGRELDMFGHRDLYSTSCPGDLLYDWVLHEGYRYLAPQPPAPDPQEEDVAFLIAVTNHPGYDPRTQVVYVADWLERRWVENEAQLGAMLAGGLAPAIAVDYDQVELDAYGILVGASP